MSKRRMSQQQLGELVGAQPAPIKGGRPERRWVEGGLTVPRALLQYALSKGKQKQLATYCRWRHETWNKGGFIFQKHLKGITDRRHLAFLVKIGWIRRVKLGVYQIVSARKIAAGEFRSAAVLTQKDWNEDPIALCYAAWLSCYARTWRNPYDDIAISNALTREHFVVASVGNIAKNLGVSSRVVSLWKERAWEYYWQKESARRVLTEEQYQAGLRGGFDLKPYRKRSGFRVLLGPNTYYRFRIYAVKWSSFLA